MLIFDAHLDLSMNALEWNRDYTLPLHEIRAREQGQTDRDGRGNGTVCLPLQEPSMVKPIAYMLSLEGADSMVTIGHVERSYEQGLRAIGLANLGPGTYAQGTHASGGIGLKGKALLREMDRLGIILDATHLCDQSFREAMDVFKGRVWASHSNCRKLVPHERQFTCEQLKELIDRGGVIGLSLDAWMMVPGWVLWETRPEDVGVKLEHIVDHIDHVCQLAGNSLHAGIGSDLDGGFGLEESPMDLDSIADLQRLPTMLKSRGYSEQDVTNIMYGNFVRFLSEALPS